MRQSAILSSDVILHGLYVFTPRKYTIRVKAETIDVCVAEINCTLTLSSESEDGVYHTCMAEEENRITLFLFSMKLNYYLAINASRISSRLAFQKVEKVTTATTMFSARSFLFFLRLQMADSNHICMYDVR